MLQNWFHIAQQESVIQLVAKALVDKHLHVLEDYIPIKLFYDSIYSYLKLKLTSYK